MWSLLLSRQGDAPGSFLDRRQIDGGQIRIGRGATTCDWAIADQTGFLSREHCIVAAVGLDLYVTDTSTNGVALNDPAARIVPHSPVAIRVGDRLLLGDYVIRIATEAEGMGAQIGHADFGQPAAAPAAAFVQPDSWFDPATGDDPIWGGASSSEVHDFLGSAMHDFLAPAGGAASPAGWSEPMGGALSAAFSKPILAAPAPADSAAFAIPEDWDAPMSGPAAAAASDPFAAFATGTADPFAMAPAARPAATPGPVSQSAAPPRVAATDPFAAFMSPDAGAAFGGDPFAEFDLPPAAATPRADAVTAPAAAPIEPDAAFRLAAAASPELPPSASAPAAGRADEAAGWAAFCEGAGIDPEALRRAPDAMRRLGVLYRQVVLGLSDLIQDRATFKDEFRVERTQLSVGRNNPLKHLPPQDSAKLLLADPLPGFLGSEDAVRLALEDVKKHQLAMLAGVQRALSSVFDRLSPHEVERMMKAAAAQKRGFALRRGIDPWSVYQTLFEALRKDATSNRNSVMSVAFREGYEEYLRGAGAR